MHVESSPGVLVLQVQSFHQLPSPDNDSAFLLDVPGKRPPFTIPPFGLNLGDAAGTQGIGV